VAVPSAAASQVSGADGGTTIAFTAPSAASPASETWSVPTTFRLQPYGSNANFNPLSMLLNRGFDMWQIDQFSPDLFSFSYARTASAVWQATTHPARGIREYGVSRFWKTQVFPLTFTPSESRRPAWIPNYMLHFFQGGVTFVRTEGWFADRDWPAPKLWSGTFVMAAAYLTEMTEVDLYNPASATTFVDLVLFDFGGILVFNIPLVRNFVGEKMDVLDWSLQPIITPDGLLRNAGDYIAVRFELPFLDGTHFIARAGVGTWGGVSFQHNETDAISLLLGAETLTRDIDRTGDEAITMGFSGGLFYDREGSLMASLEWGTRERLVSANVFPGVLPGLLHKMGLWLSMDRKMRPHFGLIAGRLGIGLGHTPPREVGLDGPSNP
jgi:hypothetical protein